jgi:hypothetical protein
VEGLFGWSSACSSMPWRVSRKPPPNRRLDLNPG